MEAIKRSRRKRRAGDPPLRIKNREQTEQKLISAVGKVIQKHGYQGLGVNKVASEAEVHKKLIYRYFGSMNNLIEKYVVEKDFWMLTSDTLKNKATADSGDLSADIAEILEKQFDFFYDQTEMQRLIIWELSGSELMKSISVAREHLGDRFLQLTDDYFQESNVNFRALGALLSAGIYYLVLHAPVTAYCGIDLNKPDHRAELKRTIRHIIKSAFEDAKLKKKKH